MFLFKRIEVQLRGRPGLPRRRVPRTAGSRSPLAVQPARQAPRRGCLAAGRARGWRTEQLDLIVKSGVLFEGRAVVLDLQDHERALVWVENRFSHILPAGLFAYWTGQNALRVEVVNATIVGART